MGGRFTKFAYLIASAKSAKAEGEVKVINTGEKDVSADLDGEIVKLDPNANPNSSDNEDAVQKLQSALNSSLSEANNLGIFIENTNLGQAAIKDSIQAASASLSSSFDTLIRVSHTLFTEGEVFGYDQLNDFVKFYDNSARLGDLVSLKQYSDSSALNTAFPAASNNGGLGLALSGSSLRVYESDGSSWDPIFTGSSGGGGGGDIGDFNAWTSNVSGTSAFSDFDAEVDAKDGDIFINSFGTAYSLDKGIYMPTEFKLNGASIVGRVVGTEKNSAELISNGFSVSNGKGLFNQGGYFALDSTASSSKADVVESISLNNTAGLVPASNLYFRATMRIVNTLLSDWRVSILLDDKTSSFILTQNGVDFPTKVALTEADFKTEIGKGSSVSLDGDTLVELIITQNIVRLYLNGELSNSSIRKASGSTGTAQLTITSEETAGGVTSGATLLIKDLVLLAY